MYGFIINNLLDIIKIDHNRFFGLSNFFTKLLPNDEKCPRKKKFNSWILFGGPKYAYYYITMIFKGIQTIQINKC